MPAEWLEGLECIGPLAEFAGFDRWVASPAKNGLVLVGDGPLRPQYESMVPADLRADAHFAGFVPGTERPSYYASADVLLCPAVGGTFGIIVVEAMAAGCAVVAADTAGFRNVVTDGVEGFLVDVERDDDGSELAERTVRLLADAALRRRCARGSTPAWGPSSSA